MADRSPRLYSPDRMQAAISAAETVARALGVAAAADSLTLNSLDAALTAVDEASARTCKVRTGGIEVHHRPVAEREEIAGAATRSMHSSAVGGQSLQPLLHGSDQIDGSSGSLPRLRRPPSSPRSPAVTAGVAAEGSVDITVTMSKSGLSPTADKLTASHRAVATLEQLLHTLDAARPACAGSQVSQVQRRYLPGCLSTPQDLQQQLSLLHGCRQELQHATQRVKVLGTISHADCANARQFSSSTSYATCDTSDPQLDVLQHCSSRFDSSRSNSHPVSASRQVHSSKSGRGHQVVGFGSLTGQPQTAEAAAPTVPMASKNKIVQVMSGGREVVNSSSGNPLYTTAQQPSLQNVEHETPTSLDGWLEGHRH